MDRAKLSSYLEDLLLQRKVSHSLTVVEEKSACFNMKLFSPAKINLGLWIVGRRGDGYHFLESLFWPIDLVDELVIEKANKNTVKMEWMEGWGENSSLPPPEENILFKLLEQNPQLGKWSIQIKKRIPLGGGLGGGSSNAGTLLRFFLETRQLKKIDAQKIALTLGADVPFFLNPVPSWISGIGEICTPLEISHDLLHPLRFLLILPPLHCSTPEIFSAYRVQNLPFSSPPQRLTTGKVTFEKLYSFLRITKNDLEKVVLTQSPLVQEGLDLLRRTPALNAVLSGSGSTFYATFPSDAECEKNAKDVQQFCRKHHCRDIKVASFQGEHHGNHRSESIPGQ